MDLQTNLAALQPAGTRKDKQLQLTTPAKPIPARVGSQAPFVSAPGGGGGTDMELAGVKTFSSTDGFLLLSFPESATVVIGATTITIPAIIKTP